MDETPRIQYAHSQNLNAASDFPYLVLDVRGNRAQPRNPGFRVMHWHDDLQFVYVHEGELRFKTLDAEERLHAGDGLFINRSVVHLVDGQVSCRYHSFLFPERFLWYYEGSPLEARTRRITEAGAPYLVLRSQSRAATGALGLFRELAALEDRRGDNLYCAEVLLRLNALWLELLKLMAQPQPQRADPAVERARLQLEFIEAHYAEDIGLADLAASARVSESEALRCFKRAVQTTPYRYLVDFRLSKAAELLAGTDLPVSEIAHSCGFNQQSYFGKCFKERTGLTPREYRRLHASEGR